MARFLLNPFTLFIGTLLAMSASVWLGARLRRLAPLDEDRRHDFSLVLAATLTLLGLLIAFSFSMAASRYDQRKDYEEAEANAIGTAYLRCDLVAPAERDRLRALLRQYVDLRIGYYEAPRDEAGRINADTARVQAELWSLAVSATSQQPTPVNALLVAGMNDVINSQGFTQASWRNHIPMPAGVLMAMVGLICNVLVGFGSRSPPMRNPLLLVLPLIIAIAFMLINDMDAPRHGLVVIAPQNLVSLSETLKAR